MLSFEPQSLTAGTPAGSKTTRSIARLPLVGPQWIGGKIGREAFSRPKPQKPTA